MPDLFGLTREEVIAELRAKAKELAPYGRRAFPGICATMTTFKDGKVDGPHPCGLYDEEKTLAKTAAVFTRMLDAAEGLELYQPSNGDEGRGFMARWCERCTKDSMGTHDESGPQCDIVGATMFLDIDDEDYPREWRQDGPKGPRCTAFEERKP